MDDFTNLGADELEKRLLALGEVTGGTKAGRMTEEMKALREAHYKFAAFHFAAEQFCVPFAIPECRIDELTPEFADEVRDIIKLNDAIGIPSSSHENTQMSLKSHPTCNKIVHDFAFTYLFGNLRSSWLKLRIMDTEKARKFLETPGAKSYLSQPALPVWLWLEFPCAPGYLEGGTFVRLVVMVKPATMGEIVNAALVVMDFFELNDAEDERMFLLRDEEAEKRKGYGEEVKKALDLFLEDMAFGKIPFQKFSEKHAFTKLVGFGQKRKGQDEHYSVFVTEKTSKNGKDA